MAGVVVGASNRYAWLDEVIGKIARVYADEFDLVFAGREDVYDKSRGSCQKVTYRFVFKEGVRQALPNAEGAQLMKLIKGAARLAKADPPLVSTRIKGQHDFAEWGHLEEGTFMWVFLAVPKEPTKEGFNRA